MKSSEFPLESVKCITPDLDASIEYMDADDEIRPMARLIQDSTPHNMEIEVDRVKFLYTTKAKKEGGKYSIGELIVRSPKERAVYDAYDYVCIVYHPVWKDLDPSNKFIQLDKLLCGISIEVKKSGESVKKKAPFDSREYTNNMSFWGSDPVLRSSETVHLAALRYIEEQKEQKKNE